MGLCGAGGGGVDVSKMEKKWKKTSEERSEKEKKGKKGCCWMIGATIYRVLYLMYKRWLMN